MAGASGILTFSALPKFLLSRRQVEKEFHAAGLEPVARLHLLRFFSMWTTYVLRKR